MARLRHAQPSLAADAGAESERAKAGDESLKAAPYFAPRRRLDETQAARKPVLAWEGELAPGGAAARSEIGGQ